MPINVPCPQCGRTLRAPDTAAGKKIRCPACKAVVAVPAAEEEEFEQPDEEFEQPDEETAVTESPKKKPGSPTGVTETPRKKPAWDDDEPPAKKRKRDDDEDGYGVSHDEEEDARPRKKKKRRRDDDFDNYGDMRPRRRGEPHRGVMILILSIVTLLCSCLCPLICWVLGSVVLNMANEDAAKMDSGSMDRSGQSLVTAGKVCAIIGISLGLINALLGIILSIMGKL